MKSKYQDITNLTFICLSYFWLRSVHFIWTYFFCLCLQVRWSRGIQPFHIPVSHRNIVWKYMLHLVLDSKLIINCNISKYSIMIANTILSNSYDFRLYDWWGWQKVGLKRMSSEDRLNWSIVEKVKQILLILRCAEVILGIQSNTLSFQ